MRNPHRSKPKLNSGATSLLGATSVAAEHPRSLKALLPQLNHGDKTIDTAMKKIAIKGARRPSRA